MRKHNSQVRLLNSLYYMLMQQQLVFFLRAWQCDVNSNPQTNSTQMCPADSLDMPQDPVPPPKATRELTTNLTHTHLNQPSAYDLSRMQEKSGAANNMQASQGSSTTGRQCM
jgi:hypothetical protein